MCQLRNYVVALVGLLSLPLPAAPLEIRTGDCVCLVGNGLGERMQHHNWFETLLHRHFADQQLTVRNLCFPGDQPALRLRSRDFPAPDAHLAEAEANVILFFFGFNESFGDDLRGFHDDLLDLVRHTQKQAYDGAGPPRIAIVSPIAFEQLPCVGRGDAAFRNPRLREYTAVMRQIAEECDVAFADLFAPTAAAFASTDAPLTLNGAHLNDAGYRMLAPVLMRELFGRDAEPEFDAALRDAIAQKNFHWWHRYRSVNGAYLYGSRGEAGFDGTYRNRDVLQREHEILQQLTHYHDQRVWSVAQGRDPSHLAPPRLSRPITPRSNVFRSTEKGGREAPTYLTPDQQIELFDVKSGYEVQLVASEQQFPELANPVTLEFDQRGRLWVSVMPSYPHWRPGTPPDDKLLILEDDNADGRADRCTTFASGLHQPTDFAFDSKGVYVAQQPDVLWLADSDGDDHADQRVRKLTGFGTADTHHGISGMQWGPDGCLYFQEGTFKFSHVETPHGPVASNEAAVWRYDPRCEKLDVHVRFAFANPWGAAANRWGERFLSEASTGEVLWESPLSGFLPYPLKHPGGAHHFRMAAVAGGEPGVRYPPLYQPRFRPAAGLAFGSSEHVAPDDRGNLFVTNCIGIQGVLNFRVHEAGAGFGAEEAEPIVICRDPNFRPVDIDVGPDGSLYIVDWHNALIGHVQHPLRDPNRDHQHGRIWRIRHRERPLVEPLQVVDATVDELLAYLEGDAETSRVRVRRELVNRPAEVVIDRLRNWVDRLQRSDDVNESALLEALWLYRAHGSVAEDLLRALLVASDHRVRAAAVRLLVDESDSLDASLSLLASRVADPHPRVRLEAVRALSFQAAPAAAEVALEVLNHEMDAFLQYTLDETLRVLQE